jgi:hypothetical protein
MFDKTKKEQLRSGEEDETKLHTVPQCKLYRFDAGKWTQAGGGHMSLNQANSDPTKARLVLRQESTKRVFLNAPVWSGTQSKFESKQLRFSAVNHIDGTPDPVARVFLVKCKDARELQTLADELKRIEQACGPPPTPPAGATAPTGAFESPSSSAAAAADASAPPSPPPSAGVSALHMHVHVTANDGKDGDLVKLALDTARASRTEGDGVVDYVVLQVAFLPYDSSDPRSNELPITCM